MIETNLFDSLSARQQEVAILLAEGLSNKEISDKLGVSVKTVTTHRQRAMEKIGVKNTIRLTHWAFGRGLVKNWFAENEPNG